MELGNQEFIEILNMPGITWKVRRQLLVKRLGMTEEAAARLVPEPPDGRDWHPSDY